MRKDSARWLTWTVIAILAGLIACGMAAAAEPSLKFSEPVSWPLDDGTAGTVTLVPTNAQDRVLFIVAKPGTPPVVRIYTLMLSPTPGPNPQPNPNPNPQPQPQPNPNKAAVMFVVVESKDQTPAIAVVKDAKAWRDSAEANGIRYIAVDPNAVQQNYPNVVEKAKAKGLPAIVFSDKAGAVIATEAWPVSVEAMIALVKKYGEGK